MHALWAADDSLLRLFAGHPFGGLPRALADFALLLSGHGVCWLVLFLLLFLAGGRRGRRVALTGVLAVLLAHAVAAWGLEGLFQRPDPATALSPLATLPAFQQRFSFPAVRLAESFAALPFLTRGGPAATGLLWALTGGVAWAELYAGAAYPTDLLTGAVVGLACAGLAVWLLGNPFRRRGGQVIPLPRRGRRLAGLSRLPGPR